MQAESGRVARAVLRSVLGFALGSGFVLAAAVPAQAVPGPTLTAGQPTPGTTRSVSWIVTAVNSVDLLSCSLTGPGAVDTSGYVCADGSPFGGVIDPAAPDGGYTLTVDETDSASVPVGSASATFTLDTTGPTAAATNLSVSPTAVNATTNPSATFSVEAGGSALCELLSGATVLASQAGCTSPWTVPVFGSPEGSYTVRVTGSDAVPNVGQPATATFAVDTTPPVLSGVSVSPTVTNGGTNPQATFSLVESGVTAVCRLMQGTTTLVTRNACTSPWTVLAGGLAGGSYDVVVQATDPAGNSSAPVSASFTVDRSGPTAAPSITSATPGAIGNSPTPSWTFTVGAGETAQCQFASPTAVLSPWTACGSPVTTASLLGRAEVTYTLSIRAVDSGGNVGPIATATYLYDVTAPAAPTVVLTRSIGSSTQVGASWVGSESAICTVLRPDNTVFASGGCTSPATLPVAAVEGIYTISVTLTDAAGNTSNPGTATYEYDVTPPAAPTVSGPTQGNTSTPTFVIGGTEPGEGFTCTWTLGATVQGPTVCTAGNYQPASPLVGDGDWTLSVVGRDRAGNVGPARVLTYRLDTGPPPPPVITLVNGSPGNDLTPTWTFTAEAGATTECQLKRGTALISDFAVCAGGTVTYNLSPLLPGVSPDGVYSLFVRAIDVARNVGVAARSDYILDTTPPGAPTFTVQPTGPSGAGATWVFSAGFDATQCRLTFAGAVVGNWADCSSPFTPVLSADGDYTLRVRAVDAAGNIGPVAASLPFEYDTTAPATPVLTVQPATPSPERMPIVGFTVDPTAALAECRITRRGNVVTNWTTCVSPWAADLTGVVDNKVYDLEVRAVDAAHNVSPTLTVPYLLDDTAPQTSTFVTAPTGPSRDRTPVFTFTNPVSDYAECLIGDALAPTAVWIRCTSPYTLDLAGQPDGAYRLSVRLVDLAGNISAATSVTYVLDMTAPLAPIFTLIPPSPTAVDLGDWRWTAEPGAAASCQVSTGSRVVSGWRSCRSPYWVNLAGEPDGRYALSVRVTDLAGNRSPIRTAAITRDTTAPVLRFLTTPPSTTTDRTPTWTWSVDAGASSSCLLTRGAIVVYDWRPCSGTFRPNLTGLPVGTYRLSIRATDDAGNISDVLVDTVTLVNVVAPPPAPPASTPGSSTSGPPITSHPNVPTPPRVPRPPIKAPTSSPVSAGPIPARIAPGSAIVVPGPVSRIPEVLGRAAVRSLDKPQIPVIILVLVILFLLVQNRIDRRDPKLAEAPLGAEPMLTFGSLRSAT